MNKDISTHGEIIKTHAEKCPVQSSPLHPTAKLSPVWKFIIVLNEKKTNLFFNI